MAKAKKPLQRGFVNNIILENLLHGDKYGYEIIKDVEEKTNGEIVLKQPSLYSSLKRFEAKGYITSYWGDSDIGGRRHYYTITEIGKNYYYSQQNASGTQNVTNKKPANSDNIISNNISIDDLLQKDDNIGIKTPETETILVDKTDEDNKPSHNNDINYVEENNSAISNTLSNNDTYKAKNNPDDEEYDVFDLLEDDNQSENQTEVLVKETTQPIHNFIKEKKLSEIKDIAIQDSLFEEASEEVFINLQNVDKDKIDELKLTDNNKITTIEREHLDIPLIKEQEHKFMDWENLKRESVFEKNNTEQNNITTLSINNDNQDDLEIILESNEIIIDNNETIEEVTFDSNDDSEIMLLTTDNNDYQENKINSEDTNLPIDQAYNANVLEDDLSAENNYEDFESINLNDDTTLKASETSDTKEFIDTNEDTLNNYENNVLTTEKEEVKIVVDEFGIIRSAKDIAPRKSNNIIDNVGARLNYTDPIDLKKKKEKKLEEKRKAEQEELQKQQALLADKEYNKKDYEEKERSIVDKLSRIVKEKKSDVDYKDLLGELYFDEDGLKEVNSEYETIKLSDNDDNSYEFEEDNSDIIRKNTSYTNLEDSLSKDGFKFKPYNYTVISEKKPAEFLLINKARLNFGFAFLLISLLQLGALLITLLNNNYVFKTIDNIMIGMYVGLSVLTFVATLFPYIKNRKKRSLSTFKLSQGLLFSLLIFVNTIILTYSINTLFGFQLNNLVSYLITIIIPILFSFNFVIAPFIYIIIINNKKFYL